MSSTSDVAPKTEMKLDQVQLLQDIKSLLGKIEHNQSSPVFNAGTAIAFAIAAAFSLILALAINEFLRLLFAKIPVGSGLLGAAIYAIVALVICILALFLINIYLEPFLHKLFAKKQ